MARLVPREVHFGDLPNEIKVCVLRHLSAEDLCHVALCNRSWREAANQDALWRPLCREKRWEMLGVAVDLCAEPPFVPSSPQHGEEGVTFHFDSIVTSSKWPGLGNTCRWKEIYMKARHLEGNWKKNRYHTVSFEFGSAGYDECFNYVGGRGEELFVRSLAGEGDTLVGALSNETLHIWDISNGERRHLIQGVDVSKGDKVLKMKNGVIAAGCADGKIRTYCAQTGEPLHVMTGHSLAVSRLFFDGTTIVSAAIKPFPFVDTEVQNDNDIRIWKAAEGTSRFVLQSTTDDVRLVEVDFLDETVAGAYSDHTIRLWDAQSGVCKQTIVSDAVNDMLSCRLGDGIVISANEGNVIKIWSVESGECIIDFDVPGVDFEDLDQTDPLGCLDFNGEFLLATSQDAKVRLFNLDGKFIADAKSYDTAEAFNLCVRRFHGNQFIASAECDGGPMYLWNIGPNGFRLITNLRGMMYDDEVGDHYSAAWMSETKLALVVYYDMDEDIGIPKIIVHHYW